MIRGRVLGVLAVARGLGDHGLKDYVIGKPYLSSTVVRLIEEDGDGDDDDGSEYTPRDTMASLANQCAKEALFGGGDEAIAECIMDPNGIGFDYECALCWQEDILYTQEYCACIFLQSQMTNNVGNFAVGENEVTAATCEEAHCEVGQFVPCSGATRRRMNIGERTCCCVQDVDVIAFTVHFV